MGSNAISYEFGRVIERRGGEKPRLITPKRTESGLVILELVIVEQMQERMDRARKNPALKQFVNDPRNEGKSDTDWIDTFAEWHELTIFGAKAEALIQNPEFGHRAVVDVVGATYEIGGLFEGRDGVTRQRRRETIGDKKGEITMRFPRPEEEGRTPLWDGISDLPKPGRGEGGGGGGGGREYADNEGI